ncbi:hypothetical protein KOR42_53180 [Thalassoglobus neptunius]|uniref:Uncharacterized protein n=1 Tax=Thalassoglobus neptunius TaxID=1938619 RepID=A0A5C5VAX7_9PLAN|nr:hypothetical protein [Thalassoglobus neptunius]TWT35009.1 hypothetical protein KOR42_53180 [Thalassoglobus neptunius]
MKPVVFYYADGSDVREGDNIRTGNVPKAVVLKVIQPNSQDAKDYSCEQGGILIEEYWENGPGLVVETRPDGMFWEDYELISRKQIP